MMWVVLIFATGAVAAHRDPRVNHIPQADVDELRHMGGVHRRSKDGAGSATNTVSVIQGIHSTISSQIQLTVTSSPQHVPTVSVYSGSGAHGSSSSVDTSDSSQTTDSAVVSQSTQNVQSAQFTQSFSISSSSPSTNSTTISVDASTSTSSDVSSQSSTDSTLSSVSATVSESTDATTTSAPTDSASETSSASVVSTDVKADEPTQSSDDKVAQSTDSNTDSDSSSSDALKANVMIDDTPVDHPIVTDKPLRQDPVETENEHLTDGSEEEQEIDDQVDEAQGILRSSEGSVNESSTLAANNSIHSSHHNGTHAHHNGTHHNGTHAHRNKTGEAESNLLITNGTALTHLTAVNTTSDSKLAVVRGTRIPINALNSTVAAGAKLNSTNATHALSGSGLTVNSNGPAAKFNGTHLVPVNATTHSAAIINSTTNAHARNSSVHEGDRSRTDFEDDFLTHLTDTSEPDSNFVPQSTKGETSASKLNTENTLEEVGADSGSLEYEDPSVEFDFDESDFEFDPESMEADEYDFEPELEQDSHSELFEEQEALCQSNSLLKSGSAVVVKANSTLSAPTGDRPRDITTSSDRTASSKTRN